MATSRFALITHRGHYCVEDGQRRERIEGSCLSVKYPASKGAVKRYAQRLQEEWEVRLANSNGDVRGVREALPEREVASAASELL